MNKLYLVTNDKIWLSKKNYTSNNDLDNIISSLSNDYSIQLLNRTSRTKLNFLIKNKFNLCKLKNISEKKINLLIVSITPYNFFILLNLFFLKKTEFKGYVYLRSDGFLEYKYRYGIIGYYFYNLMFSFISKKLKILSCSKNFTKVKVKTIIHPSELNLEWFKKNRNKDQFKTDFLYIGRFKKDKGAIYLVNLFKKFFKHYKLTIVGTDKKLIKTRYYNKNIKYIGSISDTQKLINIYDSAKLFILPSYIEGFPKVISESLARMRPIIIFEDIKYVVNDREGIFVCKRDAESLQKKINHILKNYSSIQKKIKKSFFYTKDNFKKELLDCIKNEFNN